MPSRIAVLAVDAVDPEVIADFWCRVLGWRVVERSDEGISIAPPDSAWPTIDVLPVAEHKTIKNRLHLDLRADGVSTEVELERLLKLGAHRVDVGQAPGASWVVLADPEASHGMRHSNHDYDAGRDLMGFLQDAYRLGLLRIVGSSYQFRHAELQDHLARDTAEPQKPVTRLLVDRSNGCPLPAHYCGCPDGCCYPRLGASSAGTTHDPVFTAPKTEGAEPADTGLYVPSTSGWQPLEVVVRPQFRAHPGR